MKLVAYILMALMFFMSYAMAKDTVIELQTGDTVLAQCLGFDCPPPIPCGSPDMGFPFGHGGSHKWEAKHGNTDCRECHGPDLMGSSKSVTSKAVSCIAPDGLVLPNGVDTVPIERANGEILTDYEGTSIGVLPVGLPVSCGFCHKEAKFKLDGESFEFKFEKWRKANGGGEDDDDD